MSNTVFSRKGKLKTLIKGYLRNFKNYFPIEGIQGEVQREEQSLIILLSLSFFTIT